MKKEGKRPKRKQLVISGLIIFLCLLAISAWKVVVIEYQIPATFFPYRIAGNPDISIAIQKSGQGIRLGKKIYEPVLEYRLKCENILAINPLDTPLRKTIDLFVEARCQRPFWPKFEFRKGYEDADRSERG